MTLTAAVLLLTSATFHAGWNFVSKRGSPSAGFFLAASVWLIPAAAGLGIYYREYYFAMPAPVWVLLCFTGACQAIYFGALAAAYRSGEMSLAYPIARSAPILIVAVEATLLGRWDELTLACGFGVALATFGCFLLPMAHLRELRVANYLNRTCAFAVLAALGTTGYTIIDDEALRILRDDGEHSAGSYGSAVLYLTAEYAVTTVWLAAYVALRRYERDAFRQMIRSQPGLTAATGYAIYITYGLVLMSLAFVDNVSYAAAFRQASIPLAALLAFAFLREPLRRPRLIGVVLVTAGLVLVALG